MNTHVPAYRTAVFAAIRTARGERTAAVSGDATETTAATPISPHQPSSSVENAAATKAVDVSSIGRDLRTTPSGKPRLLASMPRLAYCQKDPGTYLASCDCK